MFSALVLQQALLLYFVFSVSAILSNSSELESEKLRKYREATSLSRTINEILEAYDRKIRPNDGGIPVQVQVELKVVSFGNLKEGNMEFSMDIFFRQWWVDPRLQHNSSAPYNVAMDPTVTFWTPDTYFVNVKSSTFHHVTRENMRVKILKDGKIYFSTRITLEAQCDMDFRLFPMDTQNCSLIIESYAYTTQEVDYEWRKTKQNDGKGIEIVSDEMAQFEVVGVKTSSKAATNSKGSFASLKVTFSFKRRITFFLSSVFAPAIVLALLSWCCFWIKREAVPARIALGIVTILSAILLSSNLNRQMPKVSYMKALDFYMLANFGFIVMAFFEYILVLNTKPQPNWLTRLYSILESNKQGNEAKRQAEPDKREPQGGLILPNPAEESVPKIKSVLITEEGVYPRVTIIRRNTEPPSPQRCVPPERTQDEKASRTRVKAKDAGDPPKCSVHWIDASAKALFPSCYIVFLMWFWYQYRDNLV